MVVRVFLVLAVVGVALRVAVFLQGYSNKGPYATCVQKDSDGDGIPDCRDTDDDNDGIPDIHDDDDDGDGIHDKHDEEDQATFHCSGEPQFCQREFVKCFDKDSDGDGIPDSRDPDDDNDGIPDTRDDDDDGDGIPDKHDKQNVFVTCVPKPEELSPFLTQCLEMLPTPYTALREAWRWSSWY